MFHVKHEGPGRVGLSSQQLGRLEAFAERLARAGVPRGMISRRDRDRIWERHILDSLRGVEALPPDGGRVCDLGSGGGLPGVVLAVARPGLRFVLAERRANRSDFLRGVVDDLAIRNAEVHAADVRSLEAGSFAACTARAFADASRSWHAAEPLLAPEGHLVYWAGGSFDPSAAPPGAISTVFHEPGLAGPGPLVIMSRQ
jgi:16S rRNA (guanine527-N7)-methyltransferase